MIVKVKGFGVYDVGFRIWAADFKRPLTQSHALT